MVGTISPVASSLAHTVEGYQRIIANPISQITSTASQNFVAKFHLASPQRASYHALLTYFGAQHEATDATASQPPRGHAQQEQGDHRNEPCLREEPGKSWKAAEPEPEGKITFKRALLMGASSHIQPAR